MCIKSLQYFQAHPKCHVPANKVNKYTFTYLFDKYLFITFYMAGPKWGAQHSENSTFRKLRSWHLITALHGKWMGKDWQTFFGGGPSKITADGDCSHEIKDAWFLEESYDQSRQCIQKQRHYFPNKGPSSQAPVSPVVMYGCESWTVKKAEPRRIDVFELWCWRGLLRVPWTARRSNQSILKEISPEYAVLNKDWCWNWNSCPSSQWCNPTISSSVVRFSSHLQSYPASGSFPMSQFFASGGQSIRVSASASVLIQDCIFRTDFL